MKSARGATQASFVNVTQSSLYPDTVPPNAVSVVDVAEFTVAPGFAAGMCAAAPRPKSPPPSPNPG